MISIIQKGLVHISGDITAYPNPQSLDRDRKPLPGKRKVSRVFVATGAIFLILALLMLIYVIFARPPQVNREFETRIDHPTPTSVSGASIGNSSPAIEEVKRIQPRSPTPQAKFHHVRATAPPDRTLQRQARVTGDLSKTPQTQGLSLLAPLTFQSIKLSSPEPSASPTPNSQITPCVAPATVVTPKKASFLKRVVNAIKRIFGGGRAKPAPTNSAPVICSLNASSSILIAPCASDVTSEHGPANSSLQVELTASAADADKDPLLYTWSVTGGRLTGEGNTVTWNLAGAEPGKYTATVDVADGHGHISHESKVVSVAECTQSKPPCPTVSVSCPSEASQGDLITFSSSVSSAAEVAYNWSTSAGMIISGQGTPTITVDTAGLANQTVTATVGSDPSCTGTASCSTSIRATAQMIGISFDQYGNISFNDEKARLDQFASALQQEPGSSGAIIAYGSYEGEALARGARAQNYLVNRRGINSARIIPIDGGCREEPATELWVVPSGGAMPAPSSQGAVDPCPLIPTSAGSPPAATAAPAKVRGVVRGQNGEPIAGARVLAYANDGSVKETKTDQNGSFVFDDLEPGTYRLEISAQGFGDLTVVSVVVNEGENLLPPFVMGSEKRTITLKERDIIRVEYPEPFWKNTPGDVAFVFDRRLSETEVETSQTKIDGRIEIQEKAPPVPGATPDQPYYKAHGEGYSAYATVTLIPSGSTIIEGPAKTEQPLKEAPVTWKWKLKPAVDAQEVSFRFHIDLVWRAPGLQEKYSYDWERTFSVPIVDPPLKVVAATWGYKGFGGGGVGMLAMGTVRRRRRNGDPAEGIPASAVPEEILDEVNTSVYAPRQAVPGDSFLVQVFAHLPEADPNLLRTDALAADPSAQALGAQPLEQEITRGSTLSFTLILDGLTIDKSTQTRVWKGRTTRVQFGVTVPQNAEPRSMFGTVVICENGEPVGDFRFAFKILASAAAAPEAPAVLEPVTRYQNSFISYAHEDQAEVLRRVQMLSIMRQNYFLDLVTLKSGDEWENKIYEHIDKSDCFILFWSSAAQGSEWVKKEIARALARQAGDRNAPPKIYAVPIEGPPAPQPPDELKYLQFGDELNYLIFAAERTPQPKSSS